MLNIIIILITFLSIISIIILLKLLNGTSLTFKIATAIIMILVNLILASIMYSIAQSGSTIGEMANVLRPMIIFTLFPINMILIACPLALQINKWKSEDIDSKQLQTKIIKCLIVDIFFIVIEFVYIKTYISNYF